MRINQIIIVDKACKQQVWALAQIKSMKREIKRIAKRMAILEDQISKETDERESMYLVDSWYDYFYDKSQTKKELKKFMDKYHFFL